MGKIIYLDNASTTAVDKKTVCVVNEFYSDNYFNPSASNVYSVRIKEQLDLARASLASIINASPKEIVFTSGATESNVWALTSGHKQKKFPILSTVGEHSSIYQLLLSKSTDNRVIFAKIDSFGSATENLLNEINKLDNLSLVSFIHVSNENGAVNDVTKVVSLVRKKFPLALIHCDGVQALGKIDIDLKRLDVDMYSLSAHKVGGYKGIGALYIKSGVNLTPLFWGSQENSLRGGTENVPGIISFGEAVKVVAPSPQSATRLKDLLLREINATITDVVCNSASDASPYIISLGIGGVRGEVVANKLSEEGIIVGTGSACSSKKNNRILTEMRVPQKYIDGNIRISLSSATSEDEILIAAKKLKGVVESIRGQK